MSLPAAPPDERVLMAGGAVTQIINQCPYRPGAVLIEMPDYIASWATTSIILYFRAVGVVEYAVHLRGLPIRYEKASKLKENLGKQQAKDRFRAITGRYPHTDDESDATCIGWNYVEAAEAAARATAAQIPLVGPPPITAWPPRRKVD
jgi:hypothetical protein